jgi:hypothetical protein
VGFRTNEFNTREQMYVVRQSHAHAWVEAYIPPERLDTSDLPQSPMAWRRGAWLRLDPTSAAAVELEGFAYLAQQVTNGVDWVRSAWRDHVLGMSSSQQAETYGPIAERIRELAAGLADGDAWRGLDEGKLWELAPSLLGVIWIAGVGLAVFVLLARARFGPLGRRVDRRNPGRRSRSAGNGHLSVEFYEQFEALLARCGRPRDVTETQREFAEDAGGRIAGRTGEHRIVTLALQIVDAFYHVRFGRATLDRSQTRAVEEALKEIKQAARGRST